MTNLPLLRNTKVKVETYLVDLDKTLNLLVSQNRTGSYIDC